MTPVLAPSERLNARCNPERRLAAALFLQATEQLRVLRAGAAVPAEEYPDYVFRTNRRLKYEAVPEDQRDIAWWIETEVWGWFGTETVFHHLVGLTPEDLANHFDRTQP